MRRITMLAATVSLAVALAWAPTAAGAGQPYTPTAQTLSCAPALLTAGATTTCTADGFGAGSGVAFAINPPLGSSTADAAGTASITATVPALDPGIYTVTATGVDGEGAAASATTAIEIVTDAELAELAAAPASGTGAGPESASLPVTGTDRAVPLTVVAVALVVAGGLLLLGLRKRQVS